MVEGRELLRSIVMVGEETYRIWECQRAERKYHIVYTGVVAPPCRGCGGAPEKFRVEVSRPAVEAMDREQAMAYLVGEIENAVNDQ